MNGFVTRDGDGRARTNAYIAGSEKDCDGCPFDKGMDILTEDYACQVIIK